MRPRWAMSFRLVAKLSSGVAPSFSSPRAAPPPRPWDLVLRVLAGDLGDAVGDVIDHVQPGDVLLVEQIDRLGVLLAEQGHQDVGPGDLLLARGLHVEDRPLQDPLEAQRRLGLATGHPPGSAGSSRR